MWPGTKSHLISTFIWPASRQVLYILPPPLFLPSNYTLGFVERQSYSRTATSASFIAFSARTSRNTCRSSTHQQWVSRVKNSGSSFEGLGGFLFQFTIKDTSMTCSEIGGFCSCLKKIFALNSVVRSPNFLILLKIKTPYEYLQNKVKFYSIQEVRKKLHSC